jgi:hypothetical protein
MKNFVLIPFEHVPHFVPFRFQKFWWERKVGTLNGAHTIKNYGQCTMPLEKMSVVAVNIRKLPTRVHPYIIINGKK